MSHPSHPSHDAEQAGAVQDVARLKAVLEEQRRTHRQPGIRMVYVIAAWCIIVPYTGWKLWESVEAATWAEALGWAALLILSTQLYRIAQSRKQTEATQELAHLDDVRGIGLLAEALEWPDTATRKTAIEALTRLLPRLRTDDAGLLNTRQRACLYRMLLLQNARRYGDLLVAILQALEQVGEETALPYVQRMATSRPTKTVQKRVQEAAVQCLPLLEAQIAQVRSSQTLLRAAAPELAGATALLRPAESALTDPQQLLRTSDPQESQEG
jgi:hypothetical protein